jgi:NAD/NADP transhydrogenase beta subunit
MEVSLSDIVEEYKNRLSDVTHNLIVLGIAMEQAQATIKDLTEKLEAAEAESDGD